MYYPNNIRAPLAVPKTWILAYRAGGDKGSVAVCLSGSNPSYREMMEHLTPLADAILSEFPQGSEFRKTSDGNSFTFSTEKSAMDFNNEEDKRQWISDTMNTNVNAIRPRLKKLEDS